MKKLLCAFVMTSALCAVAAPADARYYGGPGMVHVNSYTKRDGTYVQSHYRTKPDGIKSNNLSYRW